MKPQVEALGCHWHGLDRTPSSSFIATWDLTDPCPIDGAGAGVVLLLDVIEHLVNPGLALTNIARVLRPGGRLILTAPNPRWSRSRIHAVLHGYPTCFSRSDLDENGHVFTPWPHVLVKMLRDAGLELEEYVTLDGRTGWPGTPITYRYPLRLNHALGCALIERLDPSACGMSYGMVARAYDQS